MTGKEESHLVCKRQNECLVVELIVVLDTGSPETRVTSASRHFTSAAESEGVHIRGRCGSPGGKSSNVRVSVSKEGLVSLLHLRNESRLGRSRVLNSAKLKKGKTKIVREQGTLENKNMRRTTI